MIECEIKGLSVGKWEEPRPNVMREKRDNCMTQKEGLMWKKE